jgi:putative Holliday junction resolvase
MRYLGVDFGFKRIGLAISEGELASPLKIITVSSLIDAVNKIKFEAKKEEADKLIIGLPEGATGKAAQKFIAGLKKEGLDVESVDETLTTKDADSILLTMGIPRNKRKENDAQSAAIILQNYLDSKE